ncbi:MAG TPA: TetR family transcriptional regulator, partial [Streptosporangiaceae bacterium]
MKISELGNPGAEGRVQLTRGRVVSAAIKLADRDGIDSLSMRKLAQDLGVEAMSLYTHVSSKNDLLNALADAVISQIPIPAGGG